MKRFNGLGAIGRALEGGATTFTPTATTITQPRFLQTALYGSNSSSFISSTKRHLNEIANRSTHSSIRSATGTVAASALAEEVHAKELPHQSKKFLPNDVVLYQNEACPFCNKVKGVY